MIDIIVKRLNSVPYKAEDIVDEKIGSIPCAISRGRAVLDELGTGQQPVIYEILYRTGLRLGMIVEIIDTVIGEVFRAKIVSIEHSFQQDNDALVKTTNITVKKPTSFYVASV